MTGTEAVGRGLEAGVETAGGGAGAGLDGSHRDLRRLGGGQERLALVDGWDG